MIQAEKKTTRRSTEQSKQVQYGLSVYTGMRAGLSDEKQVVPDAALCQFERIFNIEPVHCSSKNAK